MNSITFDTPLPTEPTRTLCAYLGSFDPVHIGHEWVARSLAQRFDRVALLVPAFHFEKTIRPALNATLQQRMEMLRLRFGSTFLVGITEEVLFNRLHRELHRLFPRAEITFGMGDETYRKFLESPEYYRRAGLPWTPQDQRTFETLSRTIQVFGRSTAASRRTVIPPQTNGLSSTLVRGTVRKLFQHPCSQEEFTAQTTRLIHADVSGYIYNSHLYEGLPLAA